MTNGSKYREWILTYSPAEINDANKARKALKSRLKSSSFPKLHDERLVTGPRTAYVNFSAQRHRSGDFAGMSITEASKLISAEWRALSESDKKVSLLTCSWQVIAKVCAISSRTYRKAWQIPQDTSKKSKQCTIEMSNTKLPKLLELFLSILSCWCLRCDGDEQWRYAITAQKVVPPAIPESYVVATCFCVHGMQSMEI